VGQGGVIDAGPPVGHVRDGFPGKGGDDGRCRRRVADPHLPGACHGHPLGLAAVSQFDPHFQSGNRLIPGHGRSLGHVAGPAGHLAAHETRGVAEIMVDPHVHHEDLGPHMAGQDVDPRPSVEEIEDHLDRHFLREGGNPLLYHPVVSGEGEDHLLFRGGSQVPGDGHHTPGKLLQAPEGADGLGLVVEPRLGLGHQAGINGTDN